MKKVALREILEKLEMNVNAKEGGCEVIPYKLFMRVLMIYPEWPCLTSERTVHEKYKMLVDLGILSESGRINFDVWNGVLGR